MENKPIQQRRNETIMPGYILHLTAAQMFIKTQKGQEFLKTKQDKNNFLIGNLLPDTTKIKARFFLREILLWGLYKDEYLSCKSLSDSDNT